MSKHGHSRQHDPAHDHPHHHDHPHEHAPRETRAIGRGEGAGKIVFFDAPSGLAGDMTIAALVDLGVPEDVVTSAVGALGLSGFHLHFGTRERSGIVATSFDVHLDEEQPERTWREIRSLLGAPRLPEAVRQKAIAIFEHLAAAEASVHKLAPDDVHFHEVGAIDAIVDIVGAAAALEHLGADLVVSPLPMGRGFVKARHGILPLPAPATVFALAGLETYDGGLDFEFVTPTGAAICGALARGSSRWPAMVIEAAGFGAGTANLMDRPNLLRAVLGTPRERGHGDAAHVVLECNLDDVTGEILGAAIEGLIAAGAKDAWATPITMKKGRPATTLSALTSPSLRSAIIDVMIRETPTLGVRAYDVSRVERPREMAEVATKYGVLPVKIAGGPFGPARVKPEFDACLAAAKANGVSVRDVIADAMAAASALTRG